MTTTATFEKQTKALIDDLKSVCANYGLGNDGNEFKIITQVFLYKFLNDKFVHEIKRLEPKLEKAENWELELKKYPSNDYEMLMMQYYGAGVQACYRGPRLYDTEATKQTVIKVINWYKKYRDILNSDIIHLRRADGRDWDGIMHVNPDLPTKALIMLYNPLKETITRTITVPLYYTGLKGKAMVREKEGKSQIKAINTAGEIKVEVTIQPGGNTWLIVNC